MIWSAILRHCTYHEDNLTFTFNYDILQNNLYTFLHQSGAS